MGSIGLVKAAQVAGEFVNGLNLLPAHQVLVQALQGKFPRPPACGFGRALHGGAGTRALRRFRLF
jgi:hypothetical protein